MKKVAFICCVVVLLFSSSAFAEEIDNEAVLQEFQLSGAESLLKGIQLPPAAQELLPDFDPDEVAKELLYGKSETDFYGVLSRIFDFFVDELADGKEGILQILLISFLAGLIGVLTKGFGEGGIGEIAFMPSYLLIAGIGLSLFYGVAEFVREGLAFAVEFMNASLPIYSSLLLTTQKTTNVGILSPGVTACVFLLANLINSVIFPAIFVSVMVSVTEHFSKTVSIHRLNTFLKKCIRWILCLVATIFTAFLSISQVATRTLNGVGGRAGKYVIGNLVPVVGGFLTETLDTLCTCAGIIQGVMGITGVLVLAVSFVSLLIRVLARVWLLQLAAALSEPVSDPRIAAFLTDLSEALSLLLGALACAMVSFIVYLSMLMRVGSAM